MDSLSEVRGVMSRTLIRIVMELYCIPIEVSSGGDLCPDPVHMGYDSTPCSDFVQVPH